MNLLRTSCFKFSINFWFMFFKCTLEFYTLSSKPDDLIIFYVHLYHCFACVFTAAIKTDESLHVLQTDQGNHIHQWNTFIFSLFQQEMQERNHQEWKLLNTVVLPGAKWCKFLGACVTEVMTSGHTWTRATWWNWQHQYQFNWQLNPENISMFLNKYIFSWRQYSRLCSSGVYWHAPLWHGMLNCSFTVKEFAFCIDSKIYRSSLVKDNAKISLKEHNSR